MNILDYTGVSTKYTGDGLSSSEVNAINSTANSLVDVANEFLKSFCNANSELNNMTRTLSLSEAAAAVPTARRQYGMKLRFLGTSGIWLEYIYNGTDLEDSSWTTNSNWGAPVDTVIDGGEW